MLGHEALAFNVLFSRLQGHPKSLVVYPIDRFSDDTPPPHGRIKLLYL